MKTCIAMKQELNHDAFKQSIWKANDMDPNPVQFHVSILPGRAKAEYFEGGAILMERTMRVKTFVLIFCLLILTLAYEPVKSNDKDKAIASAKARKAKEEALQKEKEDSIPIKELDEIERENDFEDSEEDGDDTVEEKKQPIKKEKQKKAPKDQKNGKPAKKSKHVQKDEETLPAGTSISNMSSFDFLTIAREHRIDKLRGIINDTPVVDIDKLRQITESLKDDTDETDDDGGFEACNYATSGDSELCHCDMDEINCSDIVMDSDFPQLHTADLSIQKKDFEPKIANFSVNAITRLRKNKILPKFEKFVQSFDFSHNHIRYIDNEAFKPFTSLAKLDLSHNNLKIVKKEVFDTVKDTLHKLDLGYNNIKALADGTFEGLGNLKVLTLDGNQIQSWTKKMFKGLDSLEKLSLDNCGIDDLPADIFEYLPKLVGLSLRGNQFEEIPAVVAHLKSLKNVDMSETNLTEIRDHAFSGDSDLEGIILERMPFLSVVRDCGFCGLPKLKHLLLNDNSKLIEIHPNAFGFISSDPGHKATDIVEFDIHNSNVTTISEHMLYYDKLNTFKVSGNPWQCDCDTQFLMEEKFSFKSDSVQPTCSFPADLKDRHLVTLHASEACENARFFGRIGRFSTVLFIVFLSVSLIVGGFLAYSNGTLRPQNISANARRIFRIAIKEPEVSYANLQNAGDDFALEVDFQPRPAEV
uniref:LRRCT domain-containing protein n=1 Tax=Caenorhabditis japonica TaxID=281687 RepID=A0A8R1DKC8_CAEJA